MRNVVIPKREAPRNPLPEREGSFAADPPVLREAKDSG
jgi:hypothetical protein